MIFNTRSTDKDKAHRLLLENEYFSTSKRQQLFCTSLYLIILTFAILILISSNEHYLKTFALGLFFPGAGFLYWTGGENPAQFIYLIYSILTFFAFSLSLIIWIATGNVILPLLIWFVSAIIAGVNSYSLGSDAPEYVWRAAETIMPMLCIFSLVVAATLTKYHHSRQRKKGISLNSYLEKISLERSDLKQSAIDRSTKKFIPTSSAAHITIRDELSLEDLKLMRLIFDRALQPIDQFEGFEWSDQFQTAAVRYQLNFMSYALSIAQSVHLSAFKGYLTTAQKNLCLKQQDHKIWSYWKYENLWGNFRVDSDPVRPENIMYSGFLASQLAYFQTSNGGDHFEAPGSFTCTHPSGKSYPYSLPQVITLLKDQYQTAKYGLLACEPNWIYPLCNFITASALRTYDTKNNTSHWGDIEASFRTHLETEFIRPDGLIIPFRSSYTGFASPQIGGAVLQAFPCLFLNTILPDIAERQWEIFRKNIKGRNLKKSCWPIDVGNYKFSRASSYTATAAAAIEMGDHELATNLFQYLDEDCPKTTINNVTHRSNASLWAQAVELIARCSKAGALRNLSTSQTNMTGPYIKEIGYPEILVAKAINQKGMLSLVLYPGDKPGFYSLFIGGLNPKCQYTIQTNERKVFYANQQCEANLKIPVHERTEVNIYPNK